jgi:hypothetical protein
MLLIVNPPPPMTHAPPFISFKKSAGDFFFAKQLHLSRGPVAPSCCATLPLLALQENQEPIESKGIKNLLEEAQFVKEGEDKRLGGGAWRN